MSCWDNYTTESEAILNCETKVSSTPTDDTSAQMFDTLGVIVLTTLIVSLIATAIHQAMTIDRLKSELKFLKVIKPNGK
ncbi:hypothetical protein UFOVP223_3 [uncultured Caudovirales phage]|uniref:Uncharacterized protein n=1 Tax=uncultured Caudovirales phage TaxID=2100421 RepID=A0A6J5L596_9CAUD|nr:hypothetical protein UFOVP110_27 [uncultured Caudovirales phage]CAB5218865.1 hypothetical protein UFOVP223_3 [uncultured Caudovirales phage]